LPQKPIEKEIKNSEKKDDEDEEDDKSIKRDSAFHLNFEIYHPS
jgi:hypothetical protein